MYFFQSFNRLKIYAGCLKKAHLFLHITFLNLSELHEILQTHVLTIWLDVAQLKIHFLHSPAVGYLSFVLNYFRFMRVEKILPLFLTLCVCLLF
jgi:hypothetical protein